MKREELAQRMLTASKSLDKRKMKRQIREHLGYNDNSREIPRAHTCLVVAVEELAELQQKITKYMRGYRDDMGLTEEMADVILSIVYISEICGVSFDDVYKALNVKLDRIEHMDSLARQAIENSQINQGV